MERKNDIPFEHQMMFVLRRYDSVMAENIELRKEIEELTEALEELGGNNERKSLKKRIKKLSEKNESLKQKLSEKYIACTRWSQRRKTFLKIRYCM